MSKENTATPDESAVAALAHRFWIERGCPEGSPEDDWFLAERELRRLQMAGEEPERDPSLSLGE